MKSYLLHHAFTMLLLYAIEEGEHSQYSEILSSSRTLAMSKIKRQWSGMHVASETAETCCSCKVDQ